MKREAVTKLDKRNNPMSNKIDEDVMFANCDVVFIFYN